MTDQYFNTAAAQQAYDTVMKMDTDEAWLFTRAVVTDVLMEDLDANHKTLQRHLDHTISKCVHDARRAIAKRYRSEGATPELEQMTLALEQISKDSGLSEAGRNFFDPREHPRGEGGMFSTKIHAAPGKKPLGDRAMEQLQIPKSPHKLTPKQTSQYQQEYIQLANFVRTANNTYGKDVQTRVWMKNKSTNEVYHMDVGGKVDENSWNPKDEHLIGAEARSRNLSVGAASFGMASAFGARPQSAQNVGYGMKAADQGMETFADKWHEFDPRVSNSRLYNRVAGTSSYVGAMAPPGSKVQMAAAFGQFVGERGPEAERVFGPPTRRAMYRYRGTERKIDPALANVDASYSNPVTKFDRLLGYFAGDGEQKGRVPTQSLSQLQLAAGNTAPSEGIIIDKDGHPVVQAVGYGDDHYLPFNLKNLKGLKGGTYIRTRTRGGPSSEDVYTAMLAGARGFTVTSNSGTFHVEFDDDFRGGRRHNQKAQRMVGRYQRLLDAVKSGEVQAKRLDPDVEEKMWQEVDDEYGKHASPATKEAAFKEKKNAFIHSKRLTSKEKSDFDAQWEKHAATLQGEMSPRQVNRLKAEAEEDFRSERELNYQLNGNGYEAALKALQEQFPYYIKNVSYKPKPRGQFGQDTGYVQPGRNRPVMARANFYDVAANPAGAAKEGAHAKKISAASVDYQGGGKYKKGEVSAEKDESAPAEATTAAGATTTAGATGAGFKATTPEGRRAQAAQIGQVEAERAAVAKDAVELYKTALSGIAPTALPGALKDLDDQELEEKLKDPDVVAELIRNIDIQSQALVGHPNEQAIKGALQKFRRSSGRAGGKPYNPSLRFPPPLFPATFNSHEAHLKASDDAVKTRRMAKLNEDGNTVSGKEFKDMSDQDFVTELQTLENARKTVANTIKVHKDIGGTPAELEQDIDVALRGFKETPAIKQVRKQNSVEPIEQWADKVHEARYIRSLMGGGGETPKVPEPVSKVDRHLALEEMYRVTQHLLELSDLVP